MEGYCLVITTTDKLCLILGRMMIMILIKYLNICVLLPLVLHYKHYSSPYLYYFICWANPFSNEKVILKSQTYSEMKIWTGYRCSAALIAQKFCQNLFFSLFLQRNDTNQNNVYRTVYVTGTAELSPVELN
jgi:hypothetical protein